MFAGSCESSVSLHLTPWACCDLFVMSEHFTWKVSVSKLWNTHVTANHICWRLFTIGTSSSCRGNRNVAWSFGFSIGVGDGGAAAPPEFGQMVSFWAQDFIFGHSRQAQKLLSCPKVAKLPKNFSGSTFQRPTNSTRSATPMLSWALLLTNIPFLGPWGWNPNNQTNRKCKIEPILVTF